MYRAANGNESGLSASDVQGLETVVVRARKLWVVCYELKKYDDTVALGW